MGMREHGYQGSFEQRAKILPPEKILSCFGLRSGQRLADLGAGQGYFALKAAEMLGETGLVKAVEIIPERLQILRRQAEERGVAARIQTILAEAERIPLPDNDVDRALLANVLHELQDPLSYVRDTLRILVNGGEIWVIEWQKKETLLGPPSSERRTPEEWVTLLAQAGFENVWVQIFQPAHVLLRGTAIKPASIVQAQRRSIS